MRVGHGWKEWFRPSAAVCGDVSSHRHSSAVGVPWLAWGHVACVSNPRKKLNHIENDRQQLQDRRNARGGYLDKPTGRGKQITMLTLRTAFKDKVGGTDHRCTAKQLLTRIRCYNCGKPRHDTDRL